MAGRVSGFRASVECAACGHRFQHKGKSKPCPECGSRRGFMERTNRAGTKRIPVALAWEAADKESRASSEG